MNFLLWATLAMHIFAVVVWVGGLMYQTAVTLAVAKFEGSERSASTIHVLRRFLPFVWMSVWTLFVTGIVLMLFNTRFVFFQLNDRWSVLLALKQVVFFLMAFYSFGYARMLRRFDETIGEPGRMVAQAAPYYERMVQFGRVSLALGIAGLLLAAGMR